MRPPAMGLRHGRPPRTSTRRSVATASLAMSIRASAYSLPWRVVAGALAALSRASVLVIAVALVCFETRLDNPLRLLRTFVLAVVAPGLAGWLLARAFAAAVTIADGLLVVRRRDQRIEVPLEAVAGVDPWRVPLPASGVSIGLRSGRRLPVALELADPITFIDALAAAGAPPSVRAHVTTVAALYASSRRDGARRWWHPLAKYVLLALVPAVPLFRLHQWIVYGGTFGEYYTYGLQAYLLGFVAYWWTFAIYLVLWDGVLRALAEATVLVTAALAPARLDAVRRLVEILHRVAYYGGVPLFLLRIAMLAS